MLVVNGLFGDLIANGADVEYIFVEGDGWMSATREVLGKEEIEKFMQTMSLRAL